MRISDWSSDVCSSDLLGNINVFRTETRLIKGGASCKHFRRFAPLDRKRRRKHFKAVFWPWFHRCRPQHDLRPSHFARLFLGSKDQRHAAPRGAEEQDRKRVGEGKDVSVRVELGGSRIIKKKK